MLQMLYARSILHGDLWSGNYEGTPEGVAIFETSLQAKSERVA
jgi:fructosamine-3-kinase